VDAAFTDTGYYPSFDTRSKPAMTDNDTTDTLHCWIYRCSARDEMYLYLATKDDFDCVQADILRVLGSLEPAMDIDLHPDRALARVDVDSVIADLRERGFFIQLPPQRHDEALDS